MTIKEKTPSLEDNVVRSHGETVPCFPIINDGSTHVLLLGCRKLFMSARCKHHL